MDTVGVGNAASTMTAMASDAAELENRLAAVLACVRGQVQELSDLHAVQSQTGDEALLFIHTHVFAVL